MMTNLVLKGMCTRKNIGLCENREKQYQHIVAGEVPKYNITNGVQPTVLRRTIKEIIHAS